MRNIGLVFAYLVCGGHGRRVGTLIQKPQSGLDADCNKDVYVASTLQSRAPLLSALLLAFKTGAAFQPSAPGAGLRMGHPGEAYQLKKVHHTRRTTSLRAAAGAVAEAIEKDEKMSLASTGSPNNDVDQEKDSGSEWTLDKVAALGIAGILSIAVAETVFWVLSFPVSELVYYLSTGEYIDLLSQEGQLKFLAFTAGWGALGGAIAQYRTVLTAAAMTPWMDRNVVRPYVQPFLDRVGKDPSKEWVTFGSIEDVQPGGIVSGVLNSQEIAIACNSDGELFALTSTLPPTGQSATQGMLQKDVIVEQWSGTAFNLVTGEVQGKWCPSLFGQLISQFNEPQNITVFPVRKQGDVVQVLVDKVDTVEQA